MKLILFLTGNADNGSFAVPEATVMSRCGMSETTYKSARKKLIEKGWIIHKPSENGQQGEIIVDYDAIYKSAERDIENTPSPDNEYTPSNSEYTSAGVIENTHNNIEKIISSNNINYNNIKNQKVSECSTDEHGNFVF
ncbi:MAG: helix-turn-helix domain-containing protein [Clostridia bacterium]|nr:helix-turn-helix domain-containing protein [Clostridia bacterium]